MNIYFCNFQEKIVSNLRPNFDYELVSIETAQNLIDEQNEYGAWEFWNDSDLVRTCEIPFNHEKFNEILKICSWVFLEKDKSIFDKKLLWTHLDNIETLHYRYDKQSSYLFISKLVFK
jgi:hypothetical protein